MKVKLLITVKIIFHSQTKLRRSDKKYPFLQLFKPRHSEHIMFSDIKRFLQENLFEEFNPVFLNELDLDQKKLKDFMVTKIHLF